VRLIRVRFVLDNLNPYIQVEHDKYIPVEAQQTPRTAETLMASGRSALVVCVLLTLGLLSEAYTPSLIPVTRRPSPSVSAVARPLSALGCSMTASSLPLHDPAIREAQYKGNTAQYLVDLHDSRSVFDFCGGMMFQLILSDKLRSHLASVSEDGGQQPAISDAATDRMMKMPGIITPRKWGGFDELRFINCASAALRYQILILKCS